MATGHPDDAHVAEEDDSGGHKVKEDGGAHRVARAPGPVDPAVEHGPHIVEGAPADQRREADDQRLNPDPQNGNDGAPHCGDGAVVQAVHDGVVAVQSNDSQGQHRGRTVHSRSVAHIETEELQERRRTTRHHKHANKRRQ